MSLYKEIIYTLTASNSFDPLDEETLKLEAKLQGHGLASAKPIGYAGLPSGTVGLRFNSETVLARSKEHGDVIEIFGVAKAGRDMEQLIKKVAGNKL